MKTPRIEYPDGQTYRTIAGEGRGGSATMVCIVTPMVVEAGEEFDIRIAMIDEAGLAAGSYPERVVLSLPGRDLSCGVTFRGDALPLVRVKGLRLVDEGIFRFKGEAEGIGEFFSNPCVVKKDPDYRIFWGDPHLHTVLSQCHARNCRSLAFAYQAARHLSCLDWTGTTDHVSNGRCELARWKEQAAGCDIYNDPPVFATLPGYEASLRGGAGGDNNVYMDRFPSMFVDEFEDGDVRTLSEKLGEKAEAEGFDFFIVPHHTTRSEKHGEIGDEIYPGQQRMPVLEIHSKWGTSEYRGNPNALRAIHHGPSYAVDLLNRGLMLGFVAGTDTHATLTFATGAIDHLKSMPGLTAVKTPRLERGRIFDAIRRRDCYASAGERMFLEFSAGGADMGDALNIGDADSVVLSVTAAAAGEIETLEFVRDGKQLVKFEPKSWKGRFSYEDDDVGNGWLESPRLGKFHYYYIRLKCRSGAFAWSSPVWVLDRA